MPKGNPKVVRGKVQTSIYIPERLYWDFQELLPSRRIGDNDALVEALSLWTAADIPALKQHAAQRELALEDAVRTAVHDYVVPKDHLKSSPADIESPKRELDDADEKVFGMLLDVLKAGDSGSRNTVEGVLTREFEKLRSGASEKKPKPPVRSLPLNPAHHPSSTAVVPRADRPHGKSGDKKVAT